MEWILQKSELVGVRSTITLLLVWLAKLARIREKYVKVHYQDHVPPPATLPRCQERAPILQKQVDEESFGILPLLFALGLKTHGRQNSQRCNILLLNPPHM